MRLSISAVFGALLFCASCQSTRVENLVAFDATEAAFINKDGKVKIDGHAFVTNTSGRVINAAGQIVRLIPATTYARQRFAAIYGRGKWILARNIPRPDSDPEYIKYTRETKSESNGKFSFEKVGPGEYFVVTQMTWKKEDSLFSDGATMYETVRIVGAETEPVKVILSGNASGS
jgi:hypothetical protein